MSAPAATPPSNVPLAALWMVGAVVAFSSMAIAGRELSTALSTFELMTYRSAIGMILVLVVGTVAGTLGQIKMNRMRDHTLRNIFHFTGQNLWFWAVGVIPLSQVFALEFTSPLWVMVLAAIFLGERLTWVKGLAGLAGFIGVLIVIQPGSAPISGGMVAAASAAVAFAITAIFTKRLTRDQSITCILFWLTAIQLGLGLAFCLYDGAMAWPSVVAWPWVGVVALSGLVAHFSLTKAISLAPASVVMPIDFIRLPVIGGLAFLLYGEALEWTVVLGAVLIFGANYLNILTEHRRSRATIR